MSEMRFKLLQHIPPSVDFIDIGFCAGIGKIFLHGAVQGGLILCELQDGSYRLHERLKHREFSLDLDHPDGGGRRTGNIRSVVNMHSFKQTSK
jgi:hypothetical protein